MEYVHVKTPSNNGLEPSVIRRGPRLAAAQLSVAAGSAGR